jgi:RNA polymerase sigma-70 factor, ECF subfamily
MSGGASGRAFLAALDPSARSAWAEAGDLDERLALVLHTARERWPSLTVAPEAFFSFLAARAASPEALERLVVTDLYLACAWLGGDSAAHQALEQGPFREALPLLHRFNAPEDTVEEAKQRARSHLFSRDSGQAALSGYGGQGALRAWLGIMLARELLQLIRKDRRLSPLVTEELVGIADSTGDPETVYFRTLYGEQFRLAFTDALRDLDAADRRFLRYSVVERLSIDDLSVLMGVHRATAARHVAAARERLLQRARDYMKARLRVDTEELQSILQVCDHELEVSVQRLLLEP